MTTADTPDSPCAALVSLLAEHLYDRGSYVPDWPEDERALHRDQDAWTDWTDRAAKVQRLRYAKAADAALADGWRPPPEMINTPESLAALPTGTVIRFQHGDIGSVDHGLHDEWTGPDTRIHLLVPGEGMHVTARRLPKANLRATVLCSMTEQAGTV